MPYPSIPARLNSATQMIYWLRVLQSEGQKIAAELANHVSGGTLDESLASDYLDKFTWLIMALRKVQDGFDLNSVEPTAKNEISVTANTSHEFAKSMIKLLCDQLIEWGTDADLILKQAQQRHSELQH